ncbi:hypothetical protein [Agarilytica rhodophyticola]|uniref:hypothetical protein n=1 Tax=Agarilytica rhodophyticola TaxID=1737490 RepID=UPI000B3451E9|nr:hypothetical protein [Agarilytica rhodophyticola]
MKIIDNMTEAELIDGFLFEYWEYNSEDYGEALNQLLSVLCKNVSYNKVLKLVNSQVESAKVAGVWLAAMLGKKAVCIFDDIKYLIRSENAKIRYELMECFLECAASGEVVLDLVKCLDDEESAIRLRALDYLKFLSDDQIISAYEYAFGKGDTYYKYLSILRSQLKSEITIAEIEDGIVSEDVFCKRFFFMAAVRGGKDTKVLSHLAQISDDTDINKYLESFIK